MQDTVAEFLKHYQHDTEEIQDWHEINIKMQIRAFLYPVQPPLDYILSVRCILLDSPRQHVMTLRDTTGWHVVPGGRREKGETLEQTLRRELLEETGWTSDAIQQLGFSHLHQITPRPTDYPYPYPDTFHMIYTAIADTYNPNAIIRDENALEARFITLDEALKLDLPASERLFLQAAIANKT